MSSTTGTTNHQTGSTPMSIRTKTKTIFDTERENMENDFAFIIAKIKADHKRTMQSLSIKHQERLTIAKLAFNNHKRGALQVWLQLESKLRREEVDAATHEVSLKRD